jgi:hypothetical protein
MLWWQQKTAWSGFFVYAATRVVFDLALMQLVQAFTRLPELFRVHWRFGCKRTMEARIEWLRFMVRE